VLTRTVGVISLSRFLLCSCHQDKSVMPKPRTRHYPFKTFLHRDKLPATYKHCTATLEVATKLVPGLQKHVPYPSRHRDNLAAKVPGLVSGWLRRVTLTPSTAGPLCVRWLPKTYKNYPTKQEFV